ncbi:MAG: recombinase family protein [Oliverpabstia sp.]|nr:recombinase family protein [Oliverpabstia sp.]
MRFVSYTRSASCFEYEEIPDGIIGVQNEHIAAYAKEHGFSIEVKYSDRKKSAAEKAGFERMLADGMKRQFDCVMVDSIFRAGNNLWVAKEVLLQTFYYAGIHFIVVEDDFDSRAKGYEEVEKYFQEKYSQYKSRVLSNRNTTYHKEHPKLVKTSKPGKDKFKQVSSVIAHELYDVDTKKHMNRRKIYDEAVFTLVGEGFSYYSDPSSRISVEAAEQEALNSLYREKQLALMIRDRLEAGEGKEFLRKQLDVIGEEMRIHFFMVASGEESIEETEEYFKSCTLRAETMEKAYTVNNIWIRHMEEFPDDARLDKKLVKKYIHRFWIKDFRNITAETWWEDWKRMLPTEWMVD